MTSSNNPVRVYVSLGSNIEPESNLQRAVNLLRQHGDVRTISSVYRTPPYGNTDQPDFLDVVVEIHTVVAPREFKVNVLRAIEDQLGRTRDPAFKYGPLTLDMDIMLWGDSAFEFGEKPWRVPNAGILDYAADAVPLAEIAADVMHPETGERISQIAARLDPTGIHKTDVQIV